MLIFRSGPDRKLASERAIIMKVENFELVLGFINMMQIVFSVGETDFPIEK